MVKRIYVPTLGPQEWQRLLADPTKQWRTGYSARTLAHCWEEAGGWPPEIASLLASSGKTAFQSTELLLAIPEYKVDLPPRGRPSQNDLFVLAKGADGNLIAMTIEGKVAESFGPTLGDWIAWASVGKVERLLFLTSELGLPAELPPTIRYQLLHRTVAALLLARQFNARYAVMLVHSFSPSAAWYEDFRAFVGLFGVEDINPGRLCSMREVKGIELFAGWASGESEFLLA
jgi:hypothetical protein